MPAPLPAFRFASLLPTQCFPFAYSLPLLRSYAGQRRIAAPCFAGAPLISSCQASWRNGAALAAGAVVEEVIKRFFCLLRKTEKRSAHFPNLITSTYMVYELLHIGGKPPPEK